MNCNNCNEPQEAEDGIIDIIDGLCDHCREHKEWILVLNNDIRCSMDFDWE